MRWVIATISLGVIGCGAAPPMTTAVTVTQVDTLINSESAGIAFAIDVEVDVSGTVYVADFQENRIVLLDPEELTVTRIGRKGAGPSEFNGPWAIRPTRDGMLVVDRGNGRLQHLSAAGEYISSRPISHFVMRGLPYVREDGALIIGSTGRDSALILVFDSSSTPKRIGVPVVDPPEVANFTAIKAAIAAGEVPPDIRNEVFVASDASGDVWAALQTEAEIRRYGATGSLHWSAIIAEPELVAAREEFFRKNVSEKNPGRFYSLRYFSDIALVGENLWVLLNTTEDVGAVIIVIGSSGERVRRIEVPSAGGATSMAIDAKRGVIYLFTSHDAQLLAATLPK